MIRSVVGQGKLWLMNSLDWLAEALTDMVDDVDAMGEGEETEKLRRALLRAFDEACAASREQRLNQEKRARARRTRDFPHGKPIKGVAA
ncbi:MAG: hypothetical protein HY054_12675 [Proteobacteria bacterium]|nr:hypothetical protein [Pseudomonadota bacterium]